MAAELVGTQHSQEHDRFLLLEGNSCPSSISSNLPGKKRKVCAHKYPPRQAVNGLASCHRAVLAKETWDLMSLPSSKPTLGCSCSCPAQNKDASSELCQLLMGAMHIHLKPHGPLQRRIHQSDAAVLWDSCFDGFLWNLMKV